jgi:8-oxo-dGTP diphosphatase
VKTYVSCILVSKAGDIILQLRDNDPAIKDPNCLSLFAGAVEEGESLEEAITRETWEETTLEVDEFKYLFKWDNGDGRVSHVFYYNGVNIADIEVREGQGFRLIRSQADLDKYKFAPISKAILIKFFELEIAKNPH